MFQIMIVITIVIYFFFVVRLALKGPDNATYRQDQTRDFGSKIWDRPRG
jgi:hypothetical protein